MLTILKVPLRILFFSTVLTLLFACGEDQSKRKEIDSIAPIVLSTVPSSEQTQVVVGNDIFINFDKNVTAADLNNIKLLKLSNINTNATPIDFTVKTNANSIIISSNNFIPNTVYEVSISGIKNLDGVAMTNACTWNFVTIGSNAPAFFTGSTGVCSSAPQPLPGLVPNIIATVLDGSSVKIEWQRPSDDVNYYKIEKSIDVQQTFTVLDNAVTSTNYIDNKAITDVIHVYKITAGNGTGLSLESGLSNSVIPKTDVIADKYHQRIEAPPLGRIINNFSFTVAFSPDGTIMAVTELVPNVGFGIVHLYFKKSIDSTWTVFKSLALNSIQQTNDNRFGYSLSFSPDGSTLAVGTINGNVATVLSAGVVYLFDKNSDWAQSSSLISAVPSDYNFFGVAMSFSPDGNTLAIAESQGVIFTDSKKIGNVQLLTKTGQTWIVNQTLKSNLAVVGDGFGNAISFSPDGNTLAIGEINATSPSGLINAGSVQIFRKTTTWAWSETVVSDNPSVRAGFGQSVSFSPDGTVLAISEPVGNDSVSAQSDIGIVHLFSERINGWVHDISLKSKSFASGYQFGGAMSFSADSRILAVGEINGYAPGTLQAGTVQLYRKNTTWAWTKTLSALAPKQFNSFGSSVRFSTVGSILAVGELQGVDIVGINSKDGVLHVFDLSAEPTTGLNVTY